MTRSGHTTLNDRVQKHRVKLRETQCRRFEVTLAIGLIEQVRDLAKQKKIPTWQFVEGALLSVTGHADGVNVNHEK